MGNRFVIKFATKNDVTLILSFIKELAVHLKLTHEDLVTEKLLYESLFGDNKHAEAVIAYYNKIPVGYALFFKNFSTPLARPGLYLEDLYIKPEMRKMGFGRKLLVFLAKIAKKRKYARFEWLALRSDKSAVNFYKNKIKAKQMDDWVLFRLTGQALHKLAKLTD